MSEWSLTDEDSVELNEELVREALRNRIRRVYRSLSLDGQAGSDDVDSAMSLFRLLYLSNRDKPAEAMSILNQFESFSEDLHSGNLMAPYFFSMDDREYKDLIRARKFASADSDSTSRNSTRSFSSRATDDQIKMLNNQSARLDIQ